MSAIRDLFIEAIAAGKEPIEVLHIDNLVLFSPDIDLDVAKKDIDLRDIGPGDVHRLARAKGCPARWAGD